MYLRAYRSTRPRLASSPVHTTNAMRLIRRVSAAFKDVPGGQHLGPTRDYSQRLMRFDLADEDPKPFENCAIMDGASRLCDNQEEVATDFPRVVEHLRGQGLLPPLGSTDDEPMDITREPLVFPLPRSGVLSVLSRGETGGCLPWAIRLCVLTAIFTPPSPNYGWAIYR